MMQNDHLFLVAGESSSGKSASLMGLKNQEQVMFLNCEPKKLPFRSKMKEYQITDPLQVYEAFEVAEEKGDIDTIVIDTLTFLMDMYETQYVLTATDTRKAWGEYAQFFKRLMQEYVAKSSKNVIFLGHTRQEFNEQKGIYESKVPIKGSLANQGIEAYFSTVVVAKKVELKVLEKYQNDLLTITPDEEMLGFKHVFQTRLTKDSVGERIRSPLGMWDESETYIDNNVQLVIDRLHEYYG